jgi:Tfp pilus assembly protein PilV
MKKREITWRDNRGMTLVESIVAVMIMVTAVTGPLVLAYQGLRATRDARNELIAIQLASEGIEVINSVRNNNSSTDNTPTGTNWLANILPNCAPTVASPGCVIDVTQVTNLGASVWLPGAVIQCSGVDCPESRLYYYPSTGMYRQQTAAGVWTGWQSSKFRRIISVDQPNPDNLNYKRVISTVYYKRFNGTEAMVQLNDNIYNWFPELQ